ncbi:MAG: hypothetical protein DCE90_19395 [Pseudanabaena sp.]|nr:MAG: hypothetical protein DCE90_19395 [Pseudanabaena sp.]
MQKTIATVDKYAWWSVLNHGGLLIAPAKLGEFFVDDLRNLSSYVSDRLRRDLDLFSPKDGESLSNLLDTVLEQVLGLSAQYWRKGNQVDAGWTRRLMTGENLKPQRLWQEPKGGLLPVFTANNISRLGVGKGKRAVSRVVEWLRQANQPIALLTNGNQWRLIHSGSDYDAWCEADSSLWFEEGQPSLQVMALRSLLSTNTLTPEKDQGLSPLLAASAASRQGQAELSEHLGERVRQAVELLIREVLTQQEDLDIDHKSLYIAATRFIMRCVFVLFAEARNLLPRHNPIYNQSYSLQNLREQLDRVAGGRATEALRNRFSAYPRLLALFRLVYHGCSHEALPIPEYGGGLFKPSVPSSLESSEASSTDPVLRALALFEYPDDSQLPSDDLVYRILELLTRSKVKVRQGRSSTWVTIPIDFSDLSSEYIGILYEGLLDFELRQAAPDNPMVFLNLGNQPVLPLSRLEEMDDQTLESLLEKLKKQAKAPKDEAEGEAEEVDEEEIADIEEVEEEIESETDLEIDDLLQDDRVAILRDRVHQWAVKAVKVGKLVSKPRSNKGDALAKYEDEVSQLARQLIARIILPMEWFLVRWGGTRKGSGTFYTRPQLAVPTVRRTLEPLVYESSLGDLGDLKLKSPKDILSLKIGDPACGSASFPVAALRYLTEMLWQSLFVHGWLIEDDRSQMIRVGIPKDAQPEWFVQVVQDFPLSLEKGAEEISKAKLKRYVVENCIYGVDINPLAVELGRLALWVETMDRSLPFTFLDHKIKCGNALVGCWFDRFQDYPVMAWEREGGDANHTKFVHHFRDKKGKPSGDKWTQAIKDLRGNVVKAELKVLLECLDPAKASLKFPDFDLPQLPEAIHDQALMVFEQIHAQVNNPWEQEESYRVNIADSEALARLKFAFDSWCAVWFWEGEDLEFAPTPSRFYHPPVETREVIEKLARKYQFFHWELEFPDVFTSKSQGFDAIIGNPPWEIQKPNSIEFFSNFDPLYRTYGKQEAISKQLEYFTANPTIEQEWLSYNAQTKALSNWTKLVGFPFGDPELSDSYSFSLCNSSSESNYLHSLWHKKRIENKGYTNYLKHPFQLQGSADINTYKMFLELSLFLSKYNGRVGMILPSSVHNDLGSLDLRKEWLHQLDTLIKFDNEKRIFKGLEHNSKFDILIIDKSSSSSNAKVAFFAWSDADILNNLDTFLLEIDSSFIKKVSPDSLSFPELRSQNDKEILNKLYNNGIFLSENFSCFEYQTKKDKKMVFREFDLTNDVKNKNLKSSGEMPVYQGGMIWLQDHRYNYFDNNKRPVRGKLEDVDLRWSYPLVPKYWTDQKTYEKKFSDRIIDNKFHFSYYRIAYRIQSSRSNQRTFVATIIPRNCATGNSIGTLVTSNYFKLVLLTSIFSSLIHDFNVRTKITSNINSFYIPQFVSPIIESNSSIETILVKNTLKLICTSRLFEDLFNEVYTNYYEVEKQRWDLDKFALSPYERLRLKVINDVLMFYLFELTTSEVTYILTTFRGIDTKLDLALRQTTLTLIAFHELKRIGLDNFLNLNDGEGWMLPDTLRLADYGLGHDDRANQPQPVTSRFTLPDWDNTATPPNAPINYKQRFYPWQLAKTPAQSWAECERHADNLKRLLKDQQTPTPPTKSAKLPSDPDYTPPTDLLGNPLQVDLFGNVIDR